MGQGFQVVLGVAVLQRPTQEGLTDKAEFQQMNEGDDRCVTQASERGSFQAEGLAGSDAGVFTFEERHRDQCGWSSTLKGQKGQ